MKANDRKKMPLRTKVCHTVNENNILIKVLVDFLDGKKNSLP